MFFIVKLIGWGILLGIAAVALFVADAMWNRGGLFYAMMGRDRLVRDCTPMTKEALIGKGFSPVDLVFDDQPSIGVGYGDGVRVKRLTGAFTFSDGPNGPEITGRLACVAAGTSITVDVDVDALPRRMT